LLEEPRARRRQIDIAFASKLAGPSVTISIGPVVELRARLTSSTKLIIYKYDTTTWLDFQIALDIGKVSAKLMALSHQSISGILFQQHTGEITAIRRKSRENE
jgi:hypothetical protein